MVTKTYLSTYLCDRSDSSDRSDISDSGESSDSSDNTDNTDRSYSRDQKTFLTKTEFLTTTKNKNKNSFTKHIFPRMNFFTKNFFTIFFYSQAFSTKKNFPKKCFQPNLLFFTRILFFKPNNFFCQTFFSHPQLFSSWYHFFYQTTLFY